MNREERALQILLSVGGVVMLLATFAIFMPVSWMSATNDWLGLGPFTESPLVDYLTRSLSLLYAIHGGLLLVAATDIRRYRPLVLYLGIASVVAGVVLTGIDLHAGMPSYWTVGEGPFVTVAGLLITWLTLRSGSRNDAPE